MLSTGLWSALRFRIWSSACVRKCGLRAIPARPLAPRCDAGLSWAAAGLPILRGKEGRLSMEGGKQTHLLIVTLFLFSCATLLDAFPSTPGRKFGQGSAVSCNVFVLT